MSKKSERQASRLSKGGTVVATAPVNTSAPVVDAAVNVATAINPALGAMVAGLVYLCSGYAASPDRAKWSPTGKGDALVAPLAHYMNVPANGTAMRVQPTDTEVAGYTLHLAGLRSNGTMVAYTVPGQRGVWVFRRVFPWQGGPAAAPVMLSTDVPLIGAVQRAVPLTAPAPLRSAHGLLLGIGVAEGATPSTDAPQGTQDAPQGTTASE
jgi:hypothetical protein